MDPKFQLQILLWITLGLWFNQVFDDAAAAVYGGPSQIFSSSTDDTNLMFEFLLGGVEIDQDHNIGLIDKEMASMRLGRAFLALINDNIPKTLISIKQMVIALEIQKRPLSASQFESLVLGMIYTGHQARHIERGNTQQAWSELFTRMANLTINDLRGQYLITLN